MATAAAVLAPRQACAPPLPRGPGVDLANDEQRELVERLYWSRWAPQVRSAGLDEEDTLQEVFRGILARNRGRRPFDPAVSSLSNYAYIVIRSVVRNAVDAHHRAVRRGWVVGAHEDAASWERSEHGVHVR